MLQAAHEGREPALVDATLCGRAAEQTNSSYSQWEKGPPRNAHDLSRYRLAQLPQSFAANYRKAGGEITLEYIDAERHAGHPPDLSKTGDMFESADVGARHSLLQVDYSI
jgi:hypothetical protein